ncbi:MAG: PCRF domain-containing protein, partial [Defluviitaleaceae bacterium]|nr:PCRF domain-containing protein [Defluviitaleaceae bacterium]
MFDKLQELEIKYGELSEKINSPETIADQNLFRTLMKEYSNLTPIIEKFVEYRSTNEAIAEAKEMLNENLDDDFKQMVKEELKENQEKIEVISEQLKILLIPKDPNDDKNVIFEIRGGAGGDEAALFAGDLFRMYSRYAERQK